MHAYLIIGHNTQIKQKEILGKYKIRPINTVIFNQAIGVQTVREINKLLALSTTRAGEYRALILGNAHNMTIEAQNAFLKTLEEPSRDTIIILNADRESVLLPTVTSRCSIIFTPTTLIPPTSLTEQVELFEKLTQAGIGERVRFTETTGKTREQALEFIEGQLVFLHSLLHTPASPAGRSNTDTTKLPNLTRALLTAYEDLSRNVNPKMVLFELLKNY